MAHFQAVLNFVLLGVTIFICPSLPCDLRQWTSWSDCTAQPCQGGVRSRSRDLSEVTRDCHGLRCWECGKCDHAVHTCLEHQICFRDLQSAVVLQTLPGECSEKSFEGYWVKERYGWYLFVNKSYNWTKAYHYCHSMNMSLLTPRDEGENKFAIGVLHQLVGQDRSFWEKSLRPGYWSGGNDLLNEGTFMMDDLKTPVNYTNFFHGEPNDPAFGSEDCIEIEGDGRWNDFNCVANLPFICHRPCTCYSQGHCDRHTGKCRCRLQGNPSLGNYKCKPYISSIDPTFGPLAGGTQIIVRGGYLDLQEIKLQNKNCTVVYSNDSTVVFKTIQSEVTGTWPVVFDFRGEHQIKPVSFTYMKNPEIDNVRPLETFLRGGVLLTVTGKDLDSVSSPWMITNMTYRGDSTLFPTKCTPKASTVILCPTPKIELPSLLEKRSRREIKIKHQYNDEDLKFTIGFILDGYVKYKKMSESLPEYSVLTVYDNPEILVFEEQDGVRAFDHSVRPFIDIKGRRLDHDWRDQVWIQIGYNGTCVVTSVTWNQLTCRPPEVIPIVDPDNYGPRTTPPVIVHVGSISTHVGFLEWPAPQQWWQTDTFTISVASSGGALLLLCIVLIALRHGRRKKVRRELPQVLDREVAERNNYEKLFGQPQQNIDELLSLLDESLLSQVKRCTLESDRLTVGAVIGRGHFGKVLQGSLTDESSNDTRKVAVKSLKGDRSITVDELKAFLEEATITNHLEHANVLSVYGVVITKNTPYVVLPFMENGDLKSFIANPYNIFSVRELLGFGLQVARGMEYLASHKYIHRDLAARNCMVDKDLVVKVADFGLSRDIYEKEYYSVSDEKRPLPIKWMAIESLKSGIFTTKSDVWAYGVVLWELITRGCAPYADVSNFQVKDYLTEGRRLSKPEYAPTKVYQLMTQCWLEEPDSRPHFKNIVPRLMLIVNSQSQAKIKDVPIMKVEDYLQPLTMEHVQKAQSSDV